MPPDEGHKHQTLTFTCTNNGQVTYRCEECGEDIHHPTLSAGLPDHRVVRCEVCDDRPAFGVPSSCVAAYSCLLCLQHGAEPTWVVQATLELNGGIAGCADWFLDGLRVFHEGEFKTVREYATR